MKHVPTVEVHSWSREKYELTPWIRALSVSGATSSPWSQITASLNIPAALWTKVAPRQGEWLVVRDRDNKAIAWGYVDKRATGVSVIGTTVQSKVTNVATIDWLDLAARVEIYVSPSLVTQSGVAAQPRTSKRRYSGVLPAEPGTLFPVDRWTDPNTGPWRALVKAARNYFSDEQGKQYFRPIGFALQEFVKLIMRILVPPSLASEYLSAQVRTVYDQSGVDAYAPDREVEVVPGYTLAGINAIQPQGVTITGLLMQTFMADFNMVELFTSLEGPGVLESSNDPVDRRLRAKPKADEVWTPEYDVNSPPPLPYAGAQTRYQGLELVWGDDEPEPPELTDEERYGRKLAGGLAENLGRNPVIIYRMRPWRAIPLDEFVAQTVGNRRQKTLRVGKNGVEEATRPQNALGVDKFNVAAFPGTTWRYEDAPQVDKSAVLDVDFGVDDANHANLVTVGLPTQADTPIRFMQRLGLPFYSDEAILTRGLRRFQPEWPFFPPVDFRAAAGTAMSILGGVIGQAVADSSSDMLRDMRTIALLGMLYMAGADRFEGGTLLLDYSPQVRHGEPIRAVMPEGLPGEGHELVAYVDRWTHTWERVGTSVRVRTRVQFSRGLLDEEQRSEPISYTGPGGVS